MGNNNPDVLISKIILAQAKLNTLDVISAAKLLDEAIAVIETSNLKQLYWHASALLTRGKVYEQNKQPDKAAEYYTKAEAVFRKSLDGKFYDDFLLALNSMGIFYAKTTKKQRP